VILFFKIYGKAQLSAAILTAVLMLMTPYPILSQTSNITISSIKFEGLKKTPTSFIESFISSTPNSSTTEDRLEKDIQNIKNLNGVVDATFKLDTVDNQIHLTYLIQERRTALPILNFGGIQGNVWFSIGAIDNNFSGTNDLALVAYQNNEGRHSAKAFYRKPRIQSSPWGYSFSLNKWASTEPLFFEEGVVDYLYDNNAIGLTAIRNFGINRQIEIGGTFFQEKYERNNSQNIENPSGPESLSLYKALTKISVSQNFINYDFFYQKGRFMRLTFQNVYTFSDPSPFNSIKLEAKAFARPFNRWNIATRAIIAFSSNNDSPFAPFVADSHVNIRGIGNRIDRGTGQVVLNIEARFTLHHGNNWGAQFVAFADSGTWRNPGGDLSDLFDSNQFRQFVGIGLRGIYQKVFGATLRIDYGIDIYNQNERGLVLGLGQYF